MKKRALSLTVLILVLSLNFVFAGKFAPYQKVNFGDDKTSRFDLLKTKDNYPKYDLTKNILDDYKVVKEKSPKLAVKKFKKKESNALKSGTPKLYLGYYDEIQFNDTTGYPYDDGTAVYFPFNAVMEAWGASISWDPYNETSIATRGNVEIKVIGNEVYKNGALIYNGDYYYTGSAETGDFVMKFPIEPILNYIYNINHGANEYYLHEKDITKLVTTASLPTSFDLRDYNRVNPVRDQGLTPHCWAFSSTAALASSLRPNENYTFSPEHMAVFSGAYNLYPDGGGNKELSTAYYALRNGPVLESDDPLDGYGNSDAPVVKSVKEVVYLEPKDLVGVKQAIYQTGAVLTGMYAHQEDQTSDGDFEVYAYREDTSALNYKGDKRSNHAIVLVGWDDNFPKENFYYEPLNDGAFIAQNSWGTEFGEQGYFYISYEDIHLAKNATYYKNVQDAEEEPYYYYAPAFYGATGRLTVSSNTVWYESSFNADYYNGFLTEVGTFCENTSADYELYLVNDYSGDYSDLQNAQLLKTGRFDHAGYYEIELDEPQYIKGDFAILFKCTTADENYRVPIEIAYADSLEVFDIGNYGSYSTNFQNWQQGGDNGADFDICIRAFVEQRDEVESPEPYVQDNGDAIDISWDAVPSASGYQVYRADEVDGPYTEIKTTSLLSYTDSDAHVPGMPYYYKVCAYRKEGAEYNFSDFSYICECYIPGIMPIPTTPDLTLDENAGGVRLNWDEQLRVREYEVYRSDNPYDDFTLIETIDGDSQVYTNVQGLDYGSLYYYKIRACRESFGIVKYSDFSAVKGWYAGTDQAALPVVDFSVGRNPNAPSPNIRVTWSALPGVTGYQVYRADEKNGPYSLFKTTGLLRYTNSGELVPGMPYYYKVRAYKKVGASYYFGPFADSKGYYAPGDLAKPAKPNLTLGENAGGIRLNWDKQDRITGYQIYRGTSTDKPFTYLKTASGSALANTNLSGLIQGRPYYYKVRGYRMAKGVKKYGEFSEIKGLFAGTDEAALSAPNFYLEDNPNVSAPNVRVRWSKVNGADGYCIYRWDGVHKRWIGLKKTGPNARVYTNINGVVDGKTNYYAMRPYHISGSKTYYGNVGVAKGFKVQ